MSYTAVLDEPQTSTKPQAPASRQGLHHFDAQTAMKLRLLLGVDEATPLPEDIHEAHEHLSVYADRLGQRTSDTGFLMLTLAFTDLKREIHRGATQMRRPK